MLLKPAVLKGSLAIGLGVGAGPGVPGDPAFSVNNSFFSFFLQNIFNIEDQIVFHKWCQALHYCETKGEDNGHEERIEPSMEEVLAVPLPASPPTEPSNIQ